MIGETLDGRYLLLRLLGQGGMGSVYEAQQLETGRRVAIKVLAGADAAASPSLVARFAREASAAGQLETPHVVRVLDAGVDPTSSLSYIAMELLHGGDAQSLMIPGAPLEPELALRIVAQACIGLAEAHRAGVVHRDIKSANLFLAEGEGESVTVKIVDFGLAKTSFGSFAGAGGNGLTRTGTILGSPLFMAPEQARGAREADARSDLWSLGIVLFHLLTGVVPHAEIDALGELLITICSEPPPRVRDVAPWVPAAVDAIVDRALRLDPAERFQRAEEMLEALSRLLPSGMALTTTMLSGASATQRSPAASSPEAPSATAEPAPDDPAVAAGAAAPVVAPRAGDAARSAPPPALAAARSASPPALAAAPRSPALSPPAPAASSSGSLSASDQAVVSPVLSLPSPRRRSSVAPLVILAAAIVGWVLGVGMFRLQPRARAAVAASGGIAPRQSLRTEPVVTVVAASLPSSPSWQVVDAGADAPHVIPR